MKRKLSIRRFAYYVLIASILTSCIVNGTFAKFTTEDSGGDGARVAMFGIVMNIAGDLFANTYNNVDHTSNSNGPAAHIAAFNGDTISVQASANLNANDEIIGYDNVVAPGTKSATGINFTIQGQPETDLTITSTVDIKT